MTLLTVLLQAAGNASLDTLGAALGIGLVAIGAAYGIGKLAVPPWKVSPVSRKRLPISG